MGFVKKLFRTLFIIIFYTDVGGPDNNDEFKFNTRGFRL